MIGIIITTIERDELLFDCLKSIKDNWNEDYYVVVVDQGIHTEEKDNFWKELNINGKYIKTDYDIGALKGRNIAIEHLYNEGIEYTLMSADSIMFTDAIYSKELGKNSVIYSIIRFLNSHDDYFLCGFDIENRIPWECDFEKKDKFYLDIPRRPPILFENVPVLPVDICRNFFICKTEMLHNAKYDEDRKLCDHEASFNRWKEKGYKCFYNSCMGGRYIDFKPVNYLKLRKRFMENKKLMMKKYNLTGWVSYSSDLSNRFNIWKNNRPSS